MATIIKNASQAFATANSVREVAYDLTDFSGQADDYLGQVRAEATKIIQKAKQEAAAIRAQAESAGRQAAQDAIEKILDEKVADQMRSLKPALQTAISQIVDSRHAWQHHWETAMTQLACAIASRILRREISQEPQIPLTWIRESLELVGSAAKITLHLNPDDLNTLRDQVLQLTETLRPAAETKILADDAILPGGCRVVTEFGAIDMQIETQLQRLAEELC